jgi:hypothetical protein
MDEADAYDHNILCADTIRSTAEFRKMWDHLQVGED